MARDWQRRNGAHLPGEVKEPRQPNHGPGFYTLLRKAEKLGETRIVDGDGKPESDKDFYDRLKKMDRRGELAASENPIDALCAAGLITVEMQKAAHDLRGLFIKSNGKPEAKIFRYGNVGGGGERAPWREYHRKIRELEDCTGRYIAGHVVNVAVFQKSVTDLDAVIRGLGALAGE